MDNQCANIFFTHVTIYGSHSVKFANIERENIFLQVILIFLVWFVSFYLSPPPKFSSKLFFPKLVLFFLFLQGEKLVLNLCCSQGELLLFKGGVASIFYRVELFFVPLVLFFLSCLLSLYSLFELSLSICDKKGEKQMKCGNPVCFVQGEIKLFFKWGEYKNFLMYLTQGRVRIYFFIPCFILLFICLSFHTCSDVFVECFRKDRYILIKTFNLFLQLLGQES